jgi:hypothetical protein
MTAAVTEISEKNFTDHFFDVRKHPKPEKGQKMARWQAKADFVDGWVKRHVAQLLASNTAGAEGAVNILQRLVGAKERDAIRVAREMCQDLVDGMAIDKILEKPYNFVIELFYWVKPELVPNDPHWSVMEIIDTTGESHGVALAENCADLDQPEGSI